MYISLIRNSFVFVYKTLQSNVFNKCHVSFSPGRSIETYSHKKEELFFYDYDRKKEQLSFFMTTQNKAKKLLIR